MHIKGVKRAFMRRRVEVKISSTLVELALSASAVMGEENEEETSSAHQFLEVLCSSSGKVRRFAAGTEAGYALYLMNQKLEIGIPQGLYIEAVRDGEEPVSFGPNAILVSYGKGWKLQTAIGKGHNEEKQMQQLLKKFPNEMKSIRLQSVKEPIDGSSSAINFQYIAKILAAFLFIFLFGGALTLFLENLPDLLVFLSSLRK